MKVMFAALTGARTATVSNGELAPNVAGPSDTPFVHVEIVDDHRTRIGTTIRMRMGIYLEPEEARQMARVLVDAADEAEGQVSA
jgi:hypothetical protein